MKTINDIRQIPKQPVRDVITRRLPPVVVDWLLNLNDPVFKYFTYAVSPKRYHFIVRDVYKLLTMDKYQLSADENNIWWLGVLLHPIWTKIKRLVSYNKTFAKAVANMTASMITKQIYKYIKDIQEGNKQALQALQQLVKSDEIDKILDYVYNVTRNAIEKAYENLAPNFSRGGADFKFDDAYVKNVNLSRKLLYKMFGALTLFANNDTLIRFETDLRPFPVKELVDQCLFDLVIAEGMQIPVNATGKSFDVYLDTSGSMNESIQVENEYVTKLRIAKGILEALKTIGIRLRRIYCFNDGIGQVTFEQALNVSANGGTNIKKVLLEIKKSRFSSIIISDYEDDIDEQNLRDVMKFANFIFVGKKESRKKYPIKFVYEIVS